MKGHSNALSLLPWVRRLRGLHLTNVYGPTSGVHPPISDLRLLNIVPSSHLLPVKHPKLSYGYLLLHNGSQHCAIGCDIFGRTCTFSSLCRLLQEGVLSPSPLLVHLRSNCSSNKHLHYRRRSHGSAVSRKT